MRQCKMCKHEEFKPVLDMGDNPLVNSLVEITDLDWSAIGGSFSPCPARNARTGHQARTHSAR